MTGRVIMILFIYKKLSELLKVTQVGAKQEHIKSIHRCLPGLSSLSGQVGRALGRCVPQPNGPQSGDGGRLPDMAWNVLNYLQRILDPLNLLLHHLETGM